MGPADPGRLNISRPLIFLRMMQYIRIRKVGRNAFQRCYRLLHQYPRFKYTVQFNGDGRSIVRLKRKRWLILSGELSNKRATIVAL